MSEARGNVPENQLFKYRRLRTIRDHLDVAANMLLGCLYQPAPEPFNEAYKSTSAARDLIQAQMDAMRVVVEREEVPDD